LNNLNHIALILDGNKRWAKQNNVSNIHGYSKGFENIKNLVKFSLSIKLSYLTVFALSSENFSRSSVKIIYDIIYKNFQNIFNELVQDKGVKIKIFGSRENLPNKIIQIFEKIETVSLNNNNLQLNIAFNYGFKNEIRNIFKKIKENKLINNIDDEKNIDKLFFIGSLPDPDILIRTGGYQRLSNFTMYQLTYTELFFTKTLWPDFSEIELQSIIDKYSKIKRKYGL
tara:strand:- start:8985 stop:9665 length:681 start_codon:yes stop_codon:yes gene_type:complete